MAQEAKPKAVRGPRIDAQRNRQRLLETAKATFAEKGEAAGLEEIARLAGVGIGTLYRHFPTRDALVEAVYRNETQQLAEAAAELATTHAPVEALRAWMRIFVDHIATKQLMAGVLGSIVGDCSDLYADAGTTRSKVRRAGSMVVSLSCAGIISPRPLKRPISTLALALNSSSSARPCGRRRGHRRSCALGHFVERRHGEIEMAPSISSGISW
jgi:AcrR family transcriptional regulator